MFEPIEKDSGYFVPTAIASLRKECNGDAQGVILDQINNDPIRPKNHSAHNLVYNFTMTKVVGFKCNCKAGVYHLIVDGHPLWSVAVEKKQLDKIRRGEKLFEPAVLATFEL